MQSPGNYAIQEFGTLAGLVKLQAAARPDHVAITDLQGSISYGRFDRLVDRIVAALQRDGVVKGDVVTICALSSIAYAAVFIGSLRAGAVISPLAPSSTVEQLGRQVSDSGARYLFLDRSTTCEFSSLADGIEGLRVFSIDDEPPFAGLTDWLAPDGAVPAAVEIGPADAFNIIYSSGTTGRPKGIVQPHGMRWRHCNPINPPGYGPDAVALLSTPLYSNTTLVAFIPALAGGGTVVLMPKFHPSEYLRLAEKHRVTHTMLVPVQYRRLMDCEEFDKTDLSRFVVKFCTSAPFPADLKREVLGRWPGGLIEYFGMTEGGGSCMLEAHLYLDKLHTVGRPMDGHKLLIMDEDGQPVAPGEIGEIVSHSSVIMNGYHNRPEETAKAIWKGADGLLYMRTGDLGRIDADGFVTVVGRKKDMIVSGGFNVYPSDLEAVLNEHPDVAESAVVGLPSERWGETPVAYCVSKTPSADAAAILAAVNTRLGKTQRLADLRIVGELPRSAIGKVLKAAIVADFLGRQPAEGAATVGI